MRNKGLLIVLFVFLVTLNFFSYRDLNITFMGQMIQLLSCSMFIYALTHFSQIRKTSNQYSSLNYVICFCLYPLLTSIVCYIYHEQSFMLSFQTLLAHWFLLIYFFLVINKISSKSIVNLIIVFAIIRTGLTLIEQFTYPNVPFAFRMSGFDDNFGKYMDVEIRSGFYRYLISDAYFLPLFAVFYSFMQLVKEISWKFLLIFLISILGIYMDQTRQIIFSMIICLCLYPFLNLNRRQIKYIFILGIIGIVIYSNMDLLFGETISKTQNEVSDDNIRVLSYAYYFSNTGDFITSLLGNGLASTKSSYGQEIAKLENWGYFRCDIGIVGALHMLGYVFILLFILYYVFVILRNWKKIDAYLRLYLLSILVNIPLIFPLYNATLPCFECFMGILFYLVDRSILQKKRSGVSLEK